ncbi:MAG: hypothetical protein N3D85_01070 [Candidatus Bathyarchaeota archaeon]|nr:hypothetical protein [Candidatus Bathyarchaeota archaeon]
MKRITVVFALILLLSAVSLTLISNIHLTKAQTTYYTINHVDHKVEVLYSGHLVITDTLQLSGQIPSTLQLGFSTKYASQVLKATAHDSNNQTIPLVLGMQGQGVTTFYGASLTIPQEATQTITTIFTLTNNLLTPTVNGFSLDFPAYPTLTATAPQVTTTLDLPFGSVNVKIEKPDGTTNTTSYTTSNLPAYTTMSATATFSSVYGYIQKVAIPNLNRQLSIMPSGEVSCIDTYKIVNTASSSVSSFKLNISFDAKNVVGKDQLGRTLTVEIQDSNVARAANVSLILPVNTGESAVITLEYKLPRVTQQAGQFILNLDSFPYLDYYVEKATVTVMPPEGAQIVSPKLTNVNSSTDLSRNVFQESLTISREGISYVDSLLPSEDVTQITFTYNPLWVSFRPSIWMWTVAIVGSILIAIYKRPRKVSVKTASTVTTAPKTVSTPVSKPTSSTPKPEASISREQIKAFTDAYEEKIRVKAEIATLDDKAQRGRIPRQKYKAKRKKLELRLNNLNQTITNIRAYMRNVTGNYAEINHQLEVAELELAEVEKLIKALQTRQDIGELSLEDYRRQLEDLERRKTKTEATINGLLLRLH